MDEKCGARDQESRYDSGSRTRDYLVKALELPIQQFRRWHEFLIGVSSLAVKSLSFAFPGDLLWFTIVGLRKFFRRSLHVQMLRIILAPRRKDAKFGNQIFLCAFAGDIPTFGCGFAALCSLWLNLFFFFGLAFLLCVLAARADGGRRCCQDRPAAFGAVDHRFAQHAAHHGAAAPAAARAGPHPGAPADLLESFCPGLNRFQDGPPAYLVAETSGFEVFDDRLRSGFLF